MSTLPPLVLGTDESRQLQDQIRHGLSRRQWSEGEDDEVMAEYILVMLANNKTGEQIAGELKELVGDGSGEASDQEGGVEGFVEWIFEERTRIGRGLDVKMESQSAGTSSGAKSREQWRGTEAKRRSLSPEARRAADGEGERGRGHSDRREGDRWADDRGTRSQIDRERGNNRQGRDQPPRRELFASRGDHTNGTMAADIVSEGPNGRRELLGGRRDRAERATVDEPTASNRGPPSVKILGQGGNQLFRRSLEQTRHQGPHHQHHQQPDQSIFSRVMVPDPRAEEFVPASQSLMQQEQPPATNLFSRLDPMMPYNPVPNAGLPNDLSVDLNKSSFPTQPQDASLCRYSLGCTNPMCPFSHPSASAVSLHKKTGSEPLVLKSDACRFQKDCTNAECAFSHISPAVTFVMAKAERGGGGGVERGAANGATACHFQMECKNVACTYAHFDPQTGQVVSPPAAAPSSNTDDHADSNSMGRMDKALSSDIKSCRFGANCTRKDCHFSHPPERQPLHISERLSRFTNGQEDQETEVIIPAA